MVVRRITIIQIKKPANQEINDELQWISKSLGLFSERDKEKSCYRIFLILLKENKPMSSDELANHTNLTRATVMHHINKLIESGLVISRNEKYLLRDDLDNLIEEIEADVISTLNEIKATTKHIKNMLNM